MVKKLVYGVGINDSKEPVYDRVDGKQVRHKDYALWQAMLGRCYGIKELQRCPQYVGCSVDPKWHQFSTFKKWLETQDWEGKQLDKDILKVGNKVYSPKTCCFVAPEINNLLHFRTRKSIYPLGVTRHSGRYSASLGKNGDKGNHLGYYDTPEEAHMVYRMAKSKYIVEKALKIEDLKVKEGLLKHAKNLWPSGLIKIIQNPCFPTNL